MAVVCFVPKVEYLHILSFVFPSVCQGSALRATILVSVWVQEMGNTHGQDNQTHKQPTSATLGALECQNFCFTGISFKWKKNTTA